MLKISTDSLKVTFGTSLQCIQGGKLSLFLILFSWTIRMLTSKSRNIVNRSICCFAKGIQRITPTFSMRNIIVAKPGAFFQKIIAIRFFFLDTIQMMSVTRHLLIRTTRGSFHTSTPTVFFTIAAHCL